jgi:hypothetical protein
MKKLVPMYASQLQERSTYNGRFRGLATWRKSFKSEWLRCQKTTISHPDDPKYASDPVAWTCACPHFVKSRFLICKHLVQAVEIVPPRFFQEVSRRRSTPFWKHATLHPLDNHTIQEPERDDNFKDSGLPHKDVEADEISDSGSLELSDELFIISSKTFDERLDELLIKLGNFTKDIEHQRQFRDSRFLTQLEQATAPYIRLIDRCNDLARRTEGHGPRPLTWEDASTMFFRPQQRLTNQDA